jgi:hypothetical protein
MWTRQHASPSTRKHMYMGLQHICRFVSSTEKQQAPGMHAAPVWVHALIP